MDTDEALTKCANAIEVLRIELQEIEESLSLQLSNDGNGCLDPFTKTKYELKSTLLIEQIKQHTELLKLKSPPSSSSSFSSSFSSTSESFPSMTKSISQISSKATVEHENNLGVEILVHNVSHSDLMVSLNNRGNISFSSTFYFLFLLTSSSSSITQL